MALEFIQLLTEMSTRNIKIIIYCDDYDDELAFVQGIFCFELSVEYASEL
jgi:hypothetical protein